MSLPFLIFEIHMFDRRFHDTHNHWVSARTCAHIFEWNIKFELTLDQIHIKQILILLRNRY